MNTKISQVDMYKWKMFERDLQKHLDIKQHYFLGKIYITVTKHFTHRVLERSYKLQHTDIRRTLYHVVNTKLCELLFWYYSGDTRKLFVQRKDLCIILTRGDTGLVVRTFWKNSNTPNKEKYFYIKL